MAYKKYTPANNAFATLAFPIDDTDLTCVLQWKYWRMPTANFILKVTHTAAGVVTGRENIYVTTRTGANCTGLVRAYEPVPTDDDATTNIQQALNFDAGDIVEVIISSEYLIDIQEEVSRLWSIPATIIWEIRIWALSNAPTWWLLCDWSAISRVTYSDLFNLLVPNKWTATISIATPWVVTLNSHWLNIWDSFYFATTWALPTWLTANTLYYVISTWFWVNSFQLSTSRWGAAINTSWTQSWVHTLFWCSYGLWNWSTTFNLPNTKWKTVVGLDTAQSEFANVSQSGGAKTHTLSASEMPSHTHTVWVTTSNTNWSTGAFWLAAIGWSTVTSSAWSWSAHNNLQPYITFNYIMKY